MKCTEKKELTLSILVEDRKNHKRNANIRNVHWIKRNQRQGLFFMKNWKITNISYKEMVKVVQRKSSWVLSRDLKNKILKNNKGNSKNYHNPNPINLVLHKSILLHSQHKNKLTTLERKNSSNRELSKI